jgi:RsiW-degrading membrane proteinase PrsW (M82 family)
MNHSEHFAEEKNVLPRLGIEPRSYGCQTCSLLAVSTTLSELGRHAVAIIAGEQHVHAEACVLYHGLVLAHCQQHGSHKRSQSSCWNCCFICRRFLAFSSITLGKFWDSSLKSSSRPLPLLPVLLAILYMKHPHWCNNHNICQYFQSQPTHTLRTVLLDGS